MAIKVRDLAKELGVTSEEVLEQLQKLYVDVEDDKSKVDDKIVGLVRMKLGIPEPVKEKPVKKVPKKKPKAKTEEKPDKKTAEKKEEKAEVKDEKKEKGAKKTKEKKEAAEEKPAVKLPHKHPGIRKVGRIEIPEVESKTKKPEKKEAAKVLTPEEIAKEKEKYEQKAPYKGGKGKRGGGIEVVKRGAQARPFARKQKMRPQVEVIEKGAMGSGKFKGKRFGKGNQARLAPKPAVTAERKTSIKLEVQLPIAMRDLAQRMSIKPNMIIQHLMAKGEMVNINAELEDQVLVREIMEQFGYILELPDTIESIEKELVQEHGEEAKAPGISRAPVVTFMGHVDHGKTSLLDYIRKTMVTKGEKGGITQHIGAYKVETTKGAVTFLDTPGHAAFTAMRARGAHATDVVVLVVAADDGVMPQTKEAIDHALAAKVPIVVAINKCDLPGADPDKVKQDLQKEGLSSEDWGGDTVMVEVSAQTGEGVDSLVEMLMLESEMLELKANPKLKARGVVIEGKKSPGQGVVVTVLVQNGTLRPGDIVLCGSYYGKVKAMMNNFGVRVEEALPATPVEILGLQGVPEAGDEFFVVKDEKKAKTLATLKQSEGRKIKMGGSQRMTLEDFHALAAAGEVKELKMILKADVQGSEEALKQSLEDLSTSEVKLDVIHSAVGNINESDVMLAMVSNAVIIGFHVKIDGQAEDLSKEENVDVRIYDIIYEAIADIKAAMEGLLEPEENEVFQGRAQVREIFSASKIGKVAGCAIIKGTIHRKDRIRLKRANEIVFEGVIDALKRFKDDVKDVKEGFECGISIKGHTDIRVNDIIESYIIEKIARRLEK